MLFNDKINQYCRFKMVIIFYVTNLSIKSNDSDITHWPFFNKKYSQGDP